MNFNVKRAGEGNAFTSWQQVKHTYGQSLAADIVSSMKVRSSQRTCGRHQSHCLVYQRFHRHCHLSLNLSSSRCIFLSCLGWSTPVFQSWSTTTKSTMNNTRQPICQVSHWNHLALFVSDSTTCLACPYRSTQYPQGSSMCQLLWTRKQHDSQHQAYHRKPHRCFYSSRWSFLL